MNIKLTKHQLWEVIDNCQTMIDSVEGTSKQYLQEAIDIMQDVYAFKIAYKLGRITEVISAPYEAWSWIESNTEFYL